MFAYQLPFGKESASCNCRTRCSCHCRQWQPLRSYHIPFGTGFGSIAAACNLPNAGSCYADYNPGFSGPVRINGDYGSGDLLGANAPAFLDKNAFVSPAAYSYGNTPRTLVYRLHNPPRYNQDLSVRREFPVREGLVFRLEADAINAFNLVNWGSPNTTITSAAFGKITSQANLPRFVQLSARLSF